MSIRECAPTTVERQSTKGPFVLRSFERNESYTINNGTVVGRELDCEVCLQYAKVSRYHAKFVVVDRALYIEDLQSSNGTYINGKRIFSRLPISIGDEISFGDKHYRMTSEQGGHGDETQLFVPSSVKPQNTGGGSIFQPSLVTSEPEPKEPEPAPQPAFLKEAFAPQENSPKQAPKPKVEAQPSAEGSYTRLYSPSQIMSMAQRNLDHHADLDIGSGPRFIILTAPLRGKVCPIGLPEAGSSIMIGRDKECEICIPEASVSRHHATITYSGLQFHIDNTHAANAIHINGELQKDSAILRHGDKVQLGRIDVLFRTDVKRDNASTPNTAETGLRPYQKWLLVGMAVTACALVTGAILLNGGV
ncbi:MAG TPA: FHA domain-containing protein [Marinagarivorans sp.]